MSQLVLDDQLDVQIILPALAGWIKAVRLQDLRPGEHVLDDRVPEILRTLKTPTFVTIDHGFWNRRLCNPGYCVPYFDLAKDEQEWLPGLLRRLFRLPDFHEIGPHGKGCAGWWVRGSVVCWVDGKKHALDLPNAD